MITRLLLCITLLSGCDIATKAVATETNNQTQFDAPPRFAGLMREPRPMLQIGIVKSGMQSRMIQESVDGPYVRYLSIDRAAVVLKHGLLHSVFGFGEGLMGADLSQSLALVRYGKTGTIMRRHTYLTGEDTTIIRSFTCDITNRGPDTIDTPNGPIQTLKMFETCREPGTDTQFENQYWVDLKAGEVLLSLQWVGDDFGALSMRYIPL